MIDLRTYSFIDRLQPQFSSFITTISKGFLPLEHQAALFVEVSPGLSINVVTDIVLKSTGVIPGMQIVERAFGLLEVHSSDQGMVREAGAKMLEYFNLKEEDRLAPRVVSQQIITGLDNHHSAIINRMRHGDFITEGQTMLVLEGHPAGYAAIAANEAEKAAPVHILEVVTFGAFGRLWLGGGEEEINEAWKAIQSVLADTHGRPNEGVSVIF